MRLIIWIIVLVQITSDTFQLPLGLGPGLSIKNLLLYLAAAGLAARIVTKRSFRLQLGSVNAAFMILMLYAIVTLFIAAFVIDYPHYKFIESAMFLKGNLIDHFLFFSVFFYGCNTREDALSATKALLFAAAAANVITAIDGAGLIHLGVTEIDDEGRVQGAMGEQNQYGAFIVTFLPGMMAAALSSRGVLRLAWGASIAFSIAALLMTASRGGMVGLLGALVWGCYVFRRRLSFEKVLLWAIAGVVGVSIIVAAISLQFGDLLKQHVLQGTFTSNATEASSGRTELWKPALELMMANPWTLISGFCWDAYAHLLTAVTHNHYLDLWFNLGLPGLLCFLFILAKVGFTARSASEIATGEAQMQLMAFVFGLMSLTIAIFFVNLYTPWPYIWAYIGAMMRLAVEVKSQSVNEASASQAFEMPRRNAGVRGRVVPAPQPLKSNGRSRA